MSDSILEFTGERFTPECLREIRYEHWHRYAFALECARGKRVLDAACGEGYGSALLAQVARQVRGVDVDATTVAHAAARYRRDTLVFEQADCTALDHLPDASFDLILSIETLEHVHEQERMLDGFRRLLADDGLLILSSPDKRTYSDARGYRNEFHVRELYRDEFEALIGARFPHYRLYGQKLLFQSALWALDDGGGPAAAVTLEGERPVVGLAYEPLYFVAVCSAQPLPEKLPSLALFGDAEESVYRHYDHEVRKNIAAGGRILELEAEVAALRAQLDARDQIPPA
jgi:SAM-dependent methyltransferase